jgi:hypothetical protein
MDDIDDIDEGLDESKMLNRLISRQKIAYQTLEASL